MTKPKRQLIDVSSLKIGQKVKYGAFSNITFQGVALSKGEEVVIMQDTFGNTKQVFKYLFEKYAIIDNE